MQAKLDSLTKNLEMINNTISSDPAAAAAAAAAATTAASVPAGPDPATVAKWKEAEAALETAQSALAERTAEAERLKDELASVRAATANDAELADAKMSGKEELELQFAALQVRQPGITTTDPFCNPATTPSMIPLPPSSGLPHRSLARRTSSSCRWPRSRGRRPSRRSRR